MPCEASSIIIKNICSDNLCQIDLKLKHNTISDHKSASLTSQTKIPCIFKAVHGSSLVFNDIMYSDLTSKTNSRILPR